MLGTLVALTIARMPNLQSFIWDMPTGILRDIWIALSSLGDHKHGRQPRLDTLWIRLHDNREILPASIPLDPTTIAQPVQAAAGATSNSIASGSNAISNDMPVPTKAEWSYRHIEHPSFSIISPLRRLCVLNIDEIAYLAELGVLIESSLDRLRELRIGIASHVRVTGWASTQNGNMGNTLSNDDSTTRNLESGGEFAVLVNKFYDCYTERSPILASADSSKLVTKSINAEVEKETITAETIERPALSPSGDPSAEVVVSNPLALSPQEAAALCNGSLNQSTELSLPQNMAVPQGEKGLVQMISAQKAPATPMPDGTEVQQLQLSSQPVMGAPITEHRAEPNGRLLHLEILELERVLLDVAVLQRTIDWCMMTSLTLFQCDRHESLWKALKRKYTPKPSLKYTRTPVHPASKCASQKPPARKAELHSSHDFPLKLRRIHTDRVSPSLISFLKETLAPNSLEWMFFQEESGLTDSDVSKYVSPVTLEAIYRGPIRHHRSSLTKILIDSGVGHSDARIRNEKWRKWMFSRELLTFMTSGKMDNLKELAMAIDYKDWVRCLLPARDFQAHKVANEVPSISSFKGSPKYRTYAHYMYLT